MPNPGYVRSTDGNDADDGSTWALANATLAGAIADAVAGDVIYSSQVHAESGTTNWTWTFPGTPANPNKLIAASDAGEPPTAVATTSSATATGTSTAAAINGSAYVYGWSFSYSSAIKLAGGGVDEVQVYDTCNFTITGTGSTHDIVVGVNNGFCHKVKLANCVFKFNLSSQSITLSTASWLIIDGGSLDAASAANPAAVISVGSRSGDLFVRGFDIANAGTGAFIIDVSGATPMSATFVDCKVPAFTTGGLIANSVPPGAVVEFWNCASDNTNYRFYRATYTGTCREETTLVKTGGASDGVTTWSTKMASNANANYPLLPLESQLMHVWNDAVGAAKTLTVDILHDSATNLTDADVWVETVSLQDSTSPLGAINSDAAADFLTAAADQAASAAAWTTTGMTNPNKQKLEVTFTPQQRGWVYFRVCLAKPSYTIYVDQAAGLA